MCYKGKQQVTAYFQVKQLLLLDMYMAYSIVYSI